MMKKEGDEIAPLSSIRIHKRKVAAAADKALILLILPSKLKKN